MSNYVRSTLFKATFEGDEITARIKPIKRKDVLKLQPVFEKLPSKEELEKGAGGPELLDVATKLAEVLPEYVTEFTGLNDAAGAPIGLIEVCEESCFNILVLQLGTALLGTAVIPNSKASVSA